MENLPDELLSNIFIRLLAKQLSQMRSVSKSWNSLLSQSSFIKSHLNRSIQINDQILLIFHRSSVSKPFTVKPTQSPRLELTNFIKLPVSPRPRFGYRNGFGVIGSVNGLICSSSGDSLIHIWNPSLSAVLTLPPPSSLPSPTVVRGYGSTIFFRFGFDPKTDDYKVVKITGITAPPRDFVKWWLQVEIYSMRKGSWKLITERFPSHITWIHDNEVICVDGHDGHLHWLGCTDDEVNPKAIVAFDLSSETFLEIHFPDSIPDNNRSNELGVLSGKLCVTSQIGADGAIEVWVMEEYGVAESWVRHHDFSQFIGDSYPLGFTSHIEFAIEDRNGRLVLYDPIANKQKVLENYCPENYGVENIVEYVDSLVWVAPVEL